MMKQTLVVLALVRLAFSASHPRKLFHEHVEEFLEIIMEEAGPKMLHLMKHYVEYDEFLLALEYMTTNDFKDLVYEMESLPEFAAVIEFLENDNIDIIYFIDWLNGLFANIDRQKVARQSTSGKDVASFVRDCIAAFPKKKLQALFDMKLATDEEFKTAVENLQTEEWDAVFGALWENDVFKDEVQTLADNGIQIEVFLEQIVAIFGQN